MQGVCHVFRGFNQFFLFDEPQHFRRRFRTRRQHEVIGQTVNDFFLPVFFDDIGRRNQGNRTRRGGGAKAGADLTGGRWFQQVAVHVAGAAAHDVTGHDIFCHGRFHKAGRRVNFHFAGFYIRLINYAAHPAVVVNVAVGIDNGDDRFLTAVLVIQIHAHFGGFCRHQRIHDGNAFFTFDDGHIGKIQIADLVDAVGHLKQAADVNQLRLPPQARVDGVRGFFTFFDEGVLLRIPYYVTLFAFNDLGGQGGNKPFMGVGEIGVI